MTGPLVMYSIKPREEFLGLQINIMKLHVLGASKLTIQEEIKVKKESRAENS
jgi:hypothetical protein